MKFSVETRDLTKVKTDLLVVNMHDGKVDSHSFANKIDKKLGGELRKVIKKEKFEGKVGQTKLINTHGKISAPYVLVLGLGDKKKFDLEVVRRGGGKIARVAKEIHATHVTTAAHGGHLDTYSKRECAQAVVEGMLLGTYHFAPYLKKSKDAFAIKQVAILCPDKTKIKEVKKGIERGELVSQGTSLARDLINTPACDMTPVQLSRAAKFLKGVRTKVLLTPQIKRLKMGAYLGVAQGAVNPPAFIEMHYKPSGKPKKKIALIGKGVTFDSGGLSIKPAKFMETMKDDMSAAAAVIGLMSIISRLKPKVEVWGFVAAAENAVDARSIRPGDIVRAMNGKTIEVLNTDAEGRLTLADALHYASQKKPDYMVDMATLTGACVVALGERYSAIMGNDQELMDQLIKVGNLTGEKLWQLPLAEEYKSELKSPIADLKNIGGNYAGTITAALFLREFVGSYKWAHLDIAGPSWTDKPLEYETRGATGVMVRSLAEWLCGSIK